MHVAYSIQNLTESEQFAAAYKTYYGLLVRYAFVLVKDKEEAQDVVADLFADLWQKRNRWLVHTDLKNYLLVSVRHAAQKRVQWKTANTAAVMPESVEEHTPHKAMVQKEQMAAMQNLLKLLPGLKYEIVQLRLLGLTYTEIADLLQISIKKVEYHLQAAVCMLQEHVQQDADYKDFSIAILLLGLLQEVTIS